MFFNCVHAKPIGETVGGRECENHNKQTHPRETGEKRDQQWVGQQFTRKTRAVAETRGLFSSSSSSAGHLLYTTEVG
jgi:hypothetical protein